MLEKQALVKKNFDSCLTPELKYQKLIELGRLLPSYNPLNKRPELIVKGCQSIVYLYSSLQNGRLYFEAESEALISSGLAFLLITFYQGETPETILTVPPTFLNDLDIPLTPSRSNGLASMYLRMKQDALISLTKQNI